MADPVLETVVLVEGQLTKEITRRGEGSSTPQSGDYVSAHYVGRLKSDGSVFDSSVSRGKPFTFTIGQGQVVRAAAAASRAAREQPDCSNFAEPRCSSGA